MSAFARYDQLFAECGRYWPEMGALRCGRPKGAGALSDGGRKRAQGGGHKKAAPHSCGAGARASRRSARRGDALAAVQTRRRTDGSVLERSPRRCAGHLGQHGGRSAGTDPQGAALGCGPPIPAADRVGDPGPPSRPQACRTTAPRQRTDRMNACTRSGTDGAPATVCAAGSGYEATALSGGSLRRPGGCSPELGHGR